MRQIHKEWKLKELKFLKQHPHLTDKQVGEFLGRTHTGVSAARKRHGMIKPKESGQFKKGGKPWNVNTPFNPGGRSVHTRFKKGNMPANAFRKVGDVFGIIDGTGKVYMFIKLEHHRQYPYGRYVYEQHFGIQLTKDDIIRFKDSDTTNCSIENLMKVTRRESILMNSNRKKAGESLKKTWAVVKTFEDFGLECREYKFRSKKKSA